MLNHLIQRVDRIGHRIAVVQARAGVVHRLNRGDISGRIIRKITRRAGQHSSAGETKVQIPEERGIDAVGAAQGGLEPRILALEGGGVEWGCTGWLPGDGLAGFDEAQGWLLVAQRPDPVGLDPP